MHPLTRFERFDDLFPTLWRRALQPVEANLPPMGEIRVDIDETEKDYLVRAEIPAAKKDDIRVEIDGNRVSITAEVRKDYEETDKNDKNRVLVRETYRGSASRSFTLAHEVDKANAVAKLEDGVLKLTLPKRTSAASRVLPIE